MLVTTTIFAKYIITIGPQPVSANITNATVALSQLKLTCKYADNSQCKQHIIDNFNWYLKTFYPRQPAYTPEEYKSKNVNTAINTVVATIASNTDNYDMTKIDESYSFEVNTSGIFINAANGYAFARALASVNQLVYVSTDLPEDKKAYSITLATVNDHSVYPWREIMIDVSRHFVPIKYLKENIDAMSLSKFNVLHLHAANSPSFSIKFEKAPQNNLVKGAFAPQFHYTIAQLKELKDYAHNRGVTLYIEIELPNNALSWAKADADLVAKCPNAIKANENRATLNPLSDKTFQYIEGIITELAEFSKYIHLGGDGPVDVCWNEDPAIKQYLDQKKININQLVAEFHEKINTITTKIGKSIQYIYYDQTFQYLGKSLKQNAIVHVLINANKAAAINAGYKVICSDQWGLDLMNPGNNAVYFYQDTYIGLYKQDVASGLDDNQKKSVLGGAGMQWGECAWGESISAHVFPRSMAISAALWAAPAKRDISVAFNATIESVACKIEQARIRSGPLQPSAPCFGHPEV